MSRFKRWFKAHSLRSWFSDLSKARNLSASGAGTSDERPFTAAENSCSEPISSKAQSGSAAGRSEAASAESAESALRWLSASAVETSEPSKGKARASRDEPRALIKE